MTCLLAVGDLHGDTKNLFRLLDTEKPDGVLCVGDWGDPGEIGPEVWDRLLSLVPVLTVFGNHDDLPLLSTLRNADGSTVLLNQGERRAFLGTSIAGVSGIWAKSHRLPHYVTDDDVADWATALAGGPPVDVLLTHGCARGIADRTPSGRPGGQQCFRDLLLAVQPRVHLCGHLHVAQTHLLTQFRATVLNTGALADGRYALVTTENDIITVEARKVT